MYRLELSAFAVVISLGGLSIASAQTSPPSPSSPPAATSKSTSETPPVPGANSFTEAQAKDRMEKAGFTQVTNLKKDDQGIWRGRAMQSGKQVNVALDFRGNVVPTQ